MIQAEIIADSLNEYGNRLTTFVLTFPRIVLAEFNTHRMISKNSASSRAIPYAKMLEMVQNNPFVPIGFMKEHKGMQGTDFFEGESANLIRTEWLKARDAAVKSSQTLSEMGLTKQMCNRILEPFMWHKVICTATDWENFFALRAHEAAEIHIQKLAYVMLDVYNNSVPKQLKTGEYHIPYGDNMNMEQLNKITQDYFEMNPSESYNTHKIDEFMIKVAVARCARVSYTVVGEDGKPDNYDNDIKLHDRLVQMGHNSPAEHVGIANTDCYSGNFRGFIQYRKTLPGENKEDSRVIKK